MVTPSVLFVCIFFQMFDLYIMFLRKEDKISIVWFALVQVGYSESNIGTGIANETRAVCWFGIVFKQILLDKNVLYMIVWFGYSSSDTIFVWCMMRLVGMDKHQQDMCVDDIGLCAKAWWPF